MEAEKEKAENGTLDFFSKQILNFGKNSYILRKTSMLEVFYGKCGKNYEIETFLRALLIPHAIGRFDTEKQC